MTVYIREAHPISDAIKATSTNARAGILFTQPSTLKERCDIASRCQAALRIESTLVVDEIDNRVGDAYAAAPDRLYVVDILGRIVYQGAPGPFGFNPLEMQQALAMSLLDGENDLGQRQTK